MQTDVLRMLRRAGKPVKISDIARTLGRSEADVITSVKRIPKVVRINGDYLEML
ncbi:MAG: hypothetical protein WC057_04665 [Dehalococcoidales bacterium]|jgi:predicted Zn-ribbon and HTH transcriptional regulator